MNSRDKLIETFKNSMVQARCRRASLIPTLIDNMERNFGINEIDDLQSRLNEKRMVLITKVKKEFLIVTQNWIDVSRQLKTRFCCPVLFLEDMDSGEILASSATENKRRYKNLNKIQEKNLPPSKKQKTLPVVVENLPEEAVTTTVLENHFFQNIPILGDLFLRPSKQLPYIPKKPEPKQNTPITLANNHFSIFHSMQNNLNKKDVQVQSPEQGFKDYTSSNSQESFEVKDLNLKDSPFNVSQFDCTLFQPLHPQSTGSTNKDLENENDLFIKKISW